MDKSKIVHTYVSGGTVQKVTVPVSQVKAITGFIFDIFLLLFKSDLTNLYNLFFLKFLTL